MNEPYRFEFDLNKESVVFDLGGYVGDWTREIYKRYEPKIYIFEPVKAHFDVLRAATYNTGAEVYNFGASTADKREVIYVHADASSVYVRAGTKQDAEFRDINKFIIEHGLEHIDLMKINIEGEEYNLIPHLINGGIICRIKTLLIQFHPFIDGAPEKRAIILGELKKTHGCTFSKDWEWEVWKRK